MKGFKGIAFPFRFAPSGGVVTSTTSPHDFSHIEESIEQIIRTQVEERVMEDFGSNLERRIFEPINRASDESAVEYSVKSAIERYENRVEVQEVSVTVQDTSIIISVDVYVEKYYATQTINVMIEGGE